MVIFWLEMTFLQLEEAFWFSGRVLDLFHLCPRLVGAYYLQCARLLHNDGLYNGQCSVNVLVGGA